MKFEHDNNFDLVRLFAASQVVFMHSKMTEVIPLLGGVLQYFPGVPVFYIVSGFLVTLSYRREGGLGFFIRRVLRIYPALWVNVTVILLAVALAESFASDLAWRRFAEWLAVTFVTGCDIYGTFAAGNIFAADGFYRAFPSGVLWTITVELTFYLLLPVIITTASLPKRLGWLVLLGWFSASYSAFLLYQHLNRVAYDAFLTKVLSINVATDLWLFMIGVGAALSWNTIKGLVEGRFGYWLAAYLVFALVHTGLSGPPGIAARFNMPDAVIWGVLLAAVVLSFAFTNRTWASVLRGNDFSYGIYLYHPLVVITLGRMQIEASSLAVALIVVGTCIFAASSWYCVERPALASKRAVTNLVMGRLGGAGRSAG